MQVLVRDNNVDQALRVLKKKMQREGVFREMKRRRFYEKPSEKTTREKAESNSSRSQTRAQAGGARRPDCRAQEKARITPRRDGAEVALCRLRRTFSLRNLQRRSIAGIGERIEQIANLRRVR